jgi:DNA replication protein DnaC
MDLSGLQSLARFHDASFQTYDPFVSGVNEAYNQATIFADQPQGWLLLIGPYGCGKTHLALSIAKQQIEQGAMVIFQVVPHLLDYLRAGFTTTDESYDTRFRQLCEVDLLILDDFGAQSNTSWAGEKLFQLMNDRYNANAPTVMTINTLAWQQIDPRLASRLHDVHLVTRIMMEQAGNYRLREDTEQST